MKSGLVVSPNLKKQPMIENKEGASCSTSKRESDSKSWNETKTFPPVPSTTRNGQEIRLLEGTKSAYKSPKALQVFLRRLVRSTKRMEVLKVFTENFRL